MTTLTKTPGIVTNSANGNEAAASKAYESKNANKNDIEKFNKALDERSGKGDGNASKGGQNELSAIFSSLMNPQQANYQGGSSQGSLPSGVATLDVEGSEKLAQLQKLADNVAERILVSDPRFSQGSEVRITLGQNVAPLNGSEIILRRDLEGMLAVEINCRNRDQFKKFVEIRSDLVTALDKHESQSVNLIINEEPAADEPKNIDDFRAYYKSY